MTGTVNVVGGGIAGLIAAVDAARAGARVRLFEASGDLGGRARTKAVQGYLLNQGPHALYQNGAFKRELDRLGVAYSGGRSLAGSRQAIAKGRLHVLPDSMGAMVKTSLFGVREKLAYTAVLKQVVDGATGDGSFAHWLDETKLAPRLRAALEALGRLSSYANGSAEVSARAMLDQIRLALGGTLYLDGGWASLVEGLAAAAREAGAELTSGAAVEQVTLDGRGSKTRLADGREFIADATILALGPNEAAQLAPGIASLRKEAQEAVPVRASTLDLALKAMPPGAHDFALGIDQPVYLSLHSRSARLAPEGGALVHIARYLPVGEAPSNARAELEGVADLAMPGWRDLEVKRQELRGMIVSHGLPRWDRPRPNVALEDAPGVFIAGDWVGPEGMIADAAAASAASAAAAALAWARRPAYA